MKEAFKLPQSQILAGKLNELRAKHKRLRKDESIKQNELEQKEIENKLKDMGKEYLINHR